MKVYLLLMILPLMTISHCVPEAMNAAVFRSYVWKSSQKLQLDFQLQQSLLSALVLELESEKANAIEPTHSSWWYEIDGLIRFFIVGVGTFTAFGFIYGHSEEQEKLEGQKISGSHDQICVQ